MGWVIRLKSDCVITDDDVDVALKYITENPYSVSYPRHVMKHDDGWMTAVDIRKPEGMEIRLSGSGTVSGHYAIEFAEHFRTALIQKCGHHIPEKIEASW